MKKLILLAVLIPRLVQSHDTTGEGNGTDPVMLDENSGWVLKHTK